MEEKKSFEAGWNTSGSIAQEMMRLRINANRKYCERDYSDACRFLSAIKLTLVANFDQSEIDKIGEYEKEFLKYESMERSIHPYKKKGKAYGELQTKIAEVFIKFNDELMRAIHKHKLGMGEKEDKAGMD